MDKNWYNNTVSLKTKVGGLTIVDDINTLQDDTVHVVIDQPSIDTNKIIESNSPNFKSFEFRPLVWEQFIGQNSSKNRVNTIVKQFNRGMRSHVLLSAIAGHGKTSWATLLASTMNLKLIQRIGRQVDETNLIDIINEINLSNKNVMLFIDEIDTLDKKIIKIFNPIVESFQLGGKRIKPFLFIGATINKHILSKNNPDFLDRLAHHINFQRYTIQELEQIINQYRVQLYSKDVVLKEDVNNIAKNCKYNPRTAINLLENRIVTDKIEDVFYNCGIIKDGLTDVDIKILNILKGSKRPMGSNAIAMRCGIPEQEYLREYEPFLYEFNYIDRVPSRIITSKGIEFLIELKG
jgi:Holliday junction resolvasome RuvABC ATP-dependent DNA helicase subunit